MFNRKFYKWLSLFLCTSLCAGSPAMTSLAGTAAFESTAQSSHSAAAPAEDQKASEEAAEALSAGELSEGESLAETLSTEAPPTETSSTTPSSKEVSSEILSTETLPTETLSTEEIPTEEIPTEVVPTEEIPTEEIPTEELSNEEIPTEEISTEELSTGELPEEEIFTEELSTENPTETEESATENLTDEELLRDAQRLETMEEAVAAFHQLSGEKQLMALLYHTDAYNACARPGSYDDTAATIETGHTLYITDVELLEDQVWYQASFWLEGTEHTGYIEAYYLAYSDEDWIAWEQEYLSEIYNDSAAYGITAHFSQTGRADTSDISAFPAIYQDALQKLKAQHPTWTFVPMNTGLDFNTVVTNEMGAKSLIQNTSGNASKGWVGNACPTESGWHYATKPAVEYHINPCNFLTEEYIFQFEQLTFNSSYHNTASIQTFLNNTFMKGKLSDDPSGRTYAQAF